MIECTLIVNSEPPYIGFAPAETRFSKENGYQFRYCTKEEIRNLLVELDVIVESEIWSTHELIFRLPMNIPKSLLAKMQLTESNLRKLAS